MKQDWKPGTMIYPLPAVLVSCGKEESEYNMFTVAWTCLLYTSINTHVFTINRTTIEDKLKSNNLLHERKTIDKNTLLSY